MGHRCCRSKVTKGLLLSVRRFWYSKPRYLGTNIFSIVSGLSFHNDPCSDSASLASMNHSFGENDTVKVEHIFTLQFSDKWDKSVRRIVDSCISFSFHFAESFRLMAMGVGAYFVLSGLARLMDSISDNKAVSKPRQGKDSE